MQLQTRGNLDLNDGFTANGEVDLVGAHIGGSLDLNGARLTNPRGRALLADGLTVDHTMSCRQGFIAEGEVRLIGANIGHQLDFRGASLTIPHPTEERRALDADKLTVGQNMLCREGFSAEGEVRLIGANIGGQLDFRGASLTNCGGRALDADKLTIGQSMFCTEGFTARGEIRLIGAEIGSQLGFRDATLTNPGGTALDLRRVRADALFLQPKMRPEGTVDLTNVQVNIYYDREDSWPEKLCMEGFSYGVLVAQPEVDVNARLHWLKRDPSRFTPQLYEQLAATYRKAGRNEDARKVAIAKQRQRRPTLNPPGRAWNSLLDWTVGYGYQTWRAAVWLLALVGLGWWIFDLAHPAHLAAAKPPGQRPWFHAGLYTLDLLFPFADLGYQGAWVADGWVRWFYLVWNLAGWVLITVVVAALSGLIKRD
jgi:hypothetical protein